MFFWNDVIRCYINCMIPLLEWHQLCSQVACSGGGHFGELGCGNTKQTLIHHVPTSTVKPTYCKSRCHSLMPRRSKAFWEQTRFKCSSEKQVNTWAGLNPGNRSEVVEEGPQNCFHLLFVYLLQFPLFQTVWKGHFICNVVHVVSSLEQLLFSCLHQICVQN